MATLRVLSDEHGIEPGAGLKEGVTLVGTLGELIYKDAKAEGVAETRIGDISNLMANTGWPIDHAMDMLAIPIADRERYRNAIELASAAASANTPESKG